MVGNFILPPTGYGPGSQPEDQDGELEYMSMPQDMRAYTAHFPEIEPDAKFEPAMELMRQVGLAALEISNGGENLAFDLSQLDTANRALVAETMGQGEVSLRMHGVPALAAQESVFAGVWVLRGAGIDKIEVGPIPAMAKTRAFNPRRAGRGSDVPRAATVVNAPPIQVELADKSAGYIDGTPAHVVNLTLLPHTEDDLSWLDAALGEGSVDILSRGYGNCRITATALPHVWRVQFFNSMDTLILDTFEVTSVPEVALAAPEDLADSSERIAEVLEAIR